MIALEAVTTSYTMKEVSYKKRYTEGKILTLTISIVSLGCREREPRDLFRADEEPKGWAIGPDRAITGSERALKLSAPRLYSPKETNTSSVGEEGGLECQQECQQDTTPGREGEEG